MTRDEAENLDINRAVKEQFLMLFDMFQETREFMEKNHPDYRRDSDHVD